MGRSQEKKVWRFPYITYWLVIRDHTYYKKIYNEFALLFKKYIYIFFVIELRKPMLHTPCGFFGLSCYFLVKSL